MTDMRMFVLSDDELVELYNGVETARAIAVKLDVSEDWVYGQWHRLRKRGMVTMRRPYGGQHSRVLPPAGDGAPSSCDDTGYDPLLDKLIKEHGEPRFDIPAALSKYKAKGKPK